MKIRQTAITLPPSRPRGRGPSEHKRPNTTRWGVTLYKPAPPARCVQAPTDGSSWGAGCTSRIPRPVGARSARACRKRFDACFENASAKPPGRTVTRTGAELQAETCRSVLEGSGRATIRRRRRADRGTRESRLAITAKLGRAAHPLARSARAGRGIGACCADRVASSRVDAVKNRPEGRHRTGGLDGHGSVAVRGAGMLRPYQRGPRPPARKGPGSNSFRNVAQPSRNLRPGGAEAWSTR